MPPRTRAAKAITQVLDEEAINTPLPPTPRFGQTERPPLGELVVGENEQIPIMMNVILKSKKPIRKKKHNKENLRRPEVLEDEYESSSSSAVDEVRRELRSVHNNFVPPHLDTRPQTPPSKAVKAARRHISPKSPCKTPRFDPEVHTLPQSARRTLQDDSFVTILQTRSCSGMNPPRAIVEEVLEDACVASPTLAVATSSMSSDSSAVSPKRNSRIEDSVQAIDALTEALEELESSLPMIMNDAEVVPFKATSASPEPKPEANTTKKRISSAPIRKKPALQEPQRQSTQLRNVKVSPPKLTMTDGELITGLRTQDSKPSLPTSKRMSESSTTRKASIYRVASIVKAPFVPFKSTKPPTQSTFVLPGDAITARKKAAHEARLIREEEEKKTKREFKARPVPFRSSIGGAPAPRPTIASQKRKSLARGIEIAEMKGSSNVAKKIIQIPPSRSSIAVQRSAIQPKAATKSLVRVKPSSKPGQRVIPASQNEELPFKKPTPALSTTTKSFARTVSVKSIARSKVAVSPPAKAIAKTKPLTDREKGDAAKNARAEAAERGRQASREWAEKERKKRQSLAKLKADTQH